MVPTPSQTGDLERHAKRRERGELAAVHHGGGVGIGRPSTPAPRSSPTARKTAQPAWPRVLFNDPGTGAARHADAGDGWRESGHDALESRCRRWRIRFQASGFRLQVGPVVRLLPRIVRCTLIPDLVLDAHGTSRRRRHDYRRWKKAWRPPPVAQGERLSGRALASGFVNDHSHAFQRGLRGAVERIEPLPREDIWTWREQMYALAEELSPDFIREVSRRCYKEMLSAGYTSVTEFHYVHHRPEGRATKTRTPWRKRWPWQPKMRASGSFCYLLPTPGTASPRFRDQVRERSLFSRGRGAQGVVGRAPAGGGRRRRPQCQGGPARVAGGDRKGRENLPLHIHAGERPREIEECQAEQDDARSNCSPRRDFSGTTAPRNSRHARRRRGSWICSPTPCLRVRVPDYGEGILAMGSYRPGRSWSAASGSPSARTRTSG